MYSGAATTYVRVYRRFPISYNIDVYKRVPAATVCTALRVCVCVCDSKTYTDGKQEKKTK